MISKKCVLIIIAMLMLTGCVFPLGPIVGGLYTDVKGPIAIDPSSKTGTVVEGRATGMGILGVTVGDFSLEAAIEDALSKSPGATRLENITADYQAKGVLCIYAEFTTIVRGVAVK